MISIVTYASYIRVIVTLDASQGFVVVLDTSQGIRGRPGHFPGDSSVRALARLTYVRGAAFLLD